MMKQAYEKATAEVTMFNNNDVITTSNFTPCECSPNGGGTYEVVKPQ